MKDFTVELCKLRHWGEIQSAARLAGGVENDNFKIIAPTGRTLGVLRVYRTKSTAEVLSEIMMIEQLIGQVNCARAVPGQNGEVVYNFNGKSAVMWTFIDGTHLKRQQFSPVEFKKLGVQLRNLHSTTRLSCFRRYFDLEMTIRTAQDLCDRLFDPYARFAEELRVEVQAARRLLISTCDQSMLHADISPANLLVSSTGELWLIDFDDASYGACILDYAISFRNIVLRRFVSASKNDVLLNLNQVAPLLEECDDLNALSMFGDWVRFATFRYLVLMLHFALKTVEYSAENKPNFSLLKLARELQDDLNAFGTMVADWRRNRLLAA